MRGLKDKITSSFIFAYVAAAVILGIGIEIIAEMERVVRRKGADQAKYWMASGPPTTWEDTRLEIFVSVSDDDGTTAQIAKAHAMIREIANEIGYTFSEMKLQAKRKAGLCFNKGGSEYCKSFAECSKKELNLVIQELIEMGDFSGINLR